MENSTSFLNLGYMSTDPTSNDYRYQANGGSSSVITSQPSISCNRDDVIIVAILGNETRKPIPIVSTIDRPGSYGDNLLLTPLNGLDLMRNADNFIIQQNCDISNILNDTENRYTVKIADSQNPEAIYYAIESSQACERTCFGSNRAFHMTLYDRTDQEAMSFKRRLAFSCCTFCCYLQKMEVWIPPGELVGVICQKWSPMELKIDVCNRHYQILYQISGSKTSMFKIYTSDGTVQIGTIVNQWDQIATRYQLSLEMPPSITDNRHKALLIGSAFLLEYMFFENRKQLSLCCC